MQKVCKMPDPMLRCRSKVSVKTEIKYAHIDASTKNTHTQKVDTMHMKGQRKRGYLKKPTASSRKKCDEEY